MPAVPALGDGGFRTSVPAMLTGEGVSVVPIISVGDTLADLTENLVTSRSDQGPSSAKSEGQRVIQDAKSKAEQLLGDVDQLIDQINSRKTL